MYRIGQGYDLHRLVKNRPLILGGVKIPHDKGLSGHSDADVLIHAVIDSILGSLAKGDIGQHFPDTASEYKDIDSRILLRETASIMDQEGFEIANLDATICAEEPRLVSYLVEMRQNIAEDLKADPKNISIKATTEEGAGITGNGEVICAMCSVLLKNL